MDTTMPNGRDLTNTAKNAMNQSVKQAEKFQSSAQPQMQELQKMGQKALDTAEDYYETAQSAVSDAADTSISFVKKYPVQFAVGAAALGLVAFFWARKNK